MLIVIRCSCPWLQQSRDNCDSQCKVLLFSRCAHVPTNLCNIVLPSQWVKTRDWNNIFLASSYQSIHIYVFYCGWMKLITFGFGHVTNLVLYGCETWSSLRERVWEQGPEDNVLPRRDWMTGSCGKLQNEERPNLHSAHNIWWWDYQKITTCLDKKCIWNFNLKTLQEKTTWEMEA